MTTYAPDIIKVDPLETVTVEASRLVDWPRFLLTAALFLAVLGFLDRAK